MESIAVTGPSRPRGKGLLVLVFTGLLFVNFFLFLLMLITDKNLQTDFGSVPPYYLHWYGVLVLSVITVILYVLMIPSLRRFTSAEGPTGTGRLTLWAAVVWSWLVIVAMVAVLASYKQVGFGSANQFARYLFGVTAYPGALSYLPWLYDLVLALFLLTAAVGTIAVRQNRRPARTAGPA